MKLLLFLIIVLIIYLIATQIKVVHTNTLPLEQRIDVENRAKIRSMLMHNHVKCHDHHGHGRHTRLNNLNTNTTKVDFNERINNTKNDYLTKDDYNTNKIDHNTNKVDHTTKNDYLSINKLLEKIKNEYLNLNYKFNIIGLPVTTRSVSTNYSYIDQKYIRHIRRNIKSWTINVDILEILEINPIFVEDTDSEFIIKVNVKLLYDNKTLHLALSYYGLIDKTDDFINDGSDVYILQLIEFNPINKSEYQQLNIEKNHDQFISMKYVDKINNMHNNEKYYQ